MFVLIETKRIPEVDLLLDQWTDVIEVENIQGH